MIKKLQCSYTMFVSWNLVCQLFETGPLQHILGDFTYKNLHPVHLPSASKKISNDDSRKTSSV